MRRRHVPALHLAQAVGEEAQLARGHQRRVELADGTGGRVAGIDEGLVALLALTLVEALEVIPAHVHLAADLQHGRRVALQPQRDLSDGAQVLRHVLPRFAVATRAAQHEHAVLVAQVDRQAVELEFGRVLDGRRVGCQAQLATHAGVEGTGAGLGGVGLGLDRQHRHAVAYRPQAFEHAAAHALRRRIGREKFGMRLLQGLQALEEPVVLGVGHLGRIEHVVEVCVAVELRAQRSGFLGGVLGHGGQLFPAQATARAMIFIATRAICMRAAARFRSEDIS